MKRKVDQDCADDREKHSQLVKEIKGLSEKQEEISKQLDECLLFYLEKIAPEERRLLEAVIERATSYCHLYMSPTMRLPKEDLLVLEKLILSEINSLIPSLGMEGLPKDLKRMHQQLTRQEEPTKVSSKKEEEVSSGGGGGSGGGGAQEERKTKKQIQSEEEQTEEKKIKKKSITKLYKRLVKSLHPDLEQDEEMKVWKEEAMKRIALAYEDRDLFALLELEEEFFDHLPEEEEVEDDEELMAYNAILEGKVEALRARINQLVLNPRYGSIQRFFRLQGIGTCSMLAEYERIKETVGIIRGFVENLQGPDGEDLFKSLVKELSA